ncbi:conjugal transfer protein TraO [Proteiniphilum sp. UBA5346]|uniref:conjugal transfer protein TraO n=1 Tax=Proteiniphilum sp. UBA5346 TaxID=1947277 RepID=UPI00257F62DF|nr:conjugal transfer protein TraO [Proteiniphilum sp. UBA5346]
MKRMLLISVTAIAIATALQAQRQLPGMRGLEARGGMVDGIYTSANDNEAGYYFGAALSTYSKRGNKWVFGAEFMERYYPYREIRTPVSQFTAEGGYYFKFLSDPSKTVLFYLGGSALGGYETSNWGEKTLYDGATLRNKESFVYGGAISLEMETYITDRIVLLLTGRQRILWGNSTGHFRMQFGGGLKFIIN